nr:hydrolase [uncultured Oscillibacter sp.]
MNTDYNIARFERELGKVQRPGMDKLLEYIRKSDFYTAPASTKYHLAAPGGLLQHSLNVLDALRGLLVRDETGEGWLYTVGGTTVATIPEDSVTVMALLHDICKTHFYGTSTRNQKNDATGKWEKVPFYTVDDKMPLGHGPKSAMIVKQYTTRTTAEMYAIWHHMGMTGDYENDNAVGKSIEMFPAVLALHTADMMASRFMEGEKENKPPFDSYPPEASSGAASAGEWADNPTTPTGEPEFQDAPPLSEGA